MDSRLRPGAAIPRRSPEYEEIVEDSEPERAEALRLKKIARKKKKAEEREAMTRLSEALSASSSEHHKPTKRPASDNVIHIIDTTDSETAARTGRSTSICSTLAIGRTVSPVPSVQAISAAHPDSIHIPVLSGSKTLNINQFIYVRSGNTSRSVSRAASTPSVVEVPAASDGEQIKNKPTKSLPKRTRVNPRTGILSNMDLTLVSKCPCCLVSWTVRKSAAAKSEHITRCMKKNKLDMDQVQQTIEAELAAPSGTTSTSTKRKGKSTTLKQTTLQSPPSARHNLLGDVVQDAAPKKRSRKAVVTTSVLPVPETHHNISSRAQTVLRDGSTEDGLDGTRSPQDHQPAFSTQPFTSSKIAGRFRKPPSPTPSVDSMSEIESLPHPPADAPEPRLWNAMAFFDDSDSRRLDVPHKRAISAATCSSSRRPNSTGLPKTRKSRTRSESLSSTPSHPRVRRSSKAPDDLMTLPATPPVGLVDEVVDNNWSDDSEACLVWDGKPAATMSSSSNASVPTKPNIKGKSKSIDLDYLKQWDSGSSVSEALATLPKARKASRSKTPTTPKKRRESPEVVSPSKRRKKQKEPRDKADSSKLKISDDGLADLFKAMILDDRLLHERILRYEPIDLEVFLEKTTELVGLPPSTQVKIKLKTFLDTAVRDLILKGNLI